MRPAGQMKAERDTGAHGSEREQREPEVEGSGIGEQGGDMITDRVVNGPPVIRVARNLEKLQVADDEIGRKRAGHGTKIWWVIAAQT